MSFWSWGSRAVSGRAPFSKTAKALVEQVGWKEVIQMALESRLTGASVTKHGYTLSTKRPPQP